MGLIIIHKIYLLVQNFLTQLKISSDAHHERFEGLSQLVLHDSVIFSKHANPRDDSNLKHIS
jgi:hypothetical protein